MHGHAHAHDHAHHHAHPHPAQGVGRYTIAIALNLAFVVAEAAAGVLANSTALLADAAHNLSDVLGLALAGAAAWLAARPGGAQRTYGYGKAGVLAALANGLILVAASGALAWEAIRRFADPAPVASGAIMAVAAIGVAINLATALLFLRGRANDINARGAFLHLMADAAVSVAVIAAGAAIMLTGLSWIDPATSLLVVAVILWSTWGLLRESLNLAMDAAPPHIRVADVRAHLLALPGVTAVHDLHVWPISANQPALTAHLVRAEGGDDAFLSSAAGGLARAFGIRHATLQVERAAADACADCGADPSHP
ncbi:MAG: cation diffusion facilitator family transporter [Alphaproteobacteria bacterium]|nr:cation diffusion facilitator family transporter [Alphaproteobacteria bacterium]